MAYEKAGKIIESHVAAMRWLTSEDTTTVVARTAQVDWHSAQTISMFRAFCIVGDIYCVPPQLLSRGMQLGGGGGGGGGGGVQRYL